MNSKMNHPLITVDGRTLMDRPLEPPNFVADTRTVRPPRPAVCANDCRGSVSNNVTGGNVWHHFLQRRI